MCQKHCSWNDAKVNWNSSIGQIIVTLSQILCHIVISRDFFPNFRNALEHEKFSGKLTKSSPPEKSLKNLNLVITDGSHTINWLLQANLFQKHLFLHQLTYNMTKDCSLNYEFSTWKLQAQHVVYINCSVCQEKNNLCTHHDLSLQFSCTELVIQWTIFFHIVG